ncbi:hypothetical protein DCM91_01350 [Chitinophaga costaii]|nr:hypothetical protein DCM91_01350 [Chitinophaga costaii]
MKTAGIFYNKLQINNLCNTILFMAHLPTCNRFVKTMISNVLGFQQKAECRIFAVLSYHTLPV